MVLRQAYNRTLSHVLCYKKAVQRGTGFELIKSLHEFCEIKRLKKLPITGGY